jgi:starch synthase
MGMEDILRSRKTALSGILNGVDYGMWNPSVDKHIVAKYSEKNTEGKSRCKESILQEMNLSQHIMRRPLLCAVSRLDFQKGVDLIVKVMDELMKMDVGVIIFGTGKSEIEDEILRVAKGNERRIAVKIGFDESFAHRIIAGADLFLIPSRYEPCGLTQMYALKYGTVPVVRATGGLDDTIIKYNANTDEGNGFKFNTFGPEPFLEAIKLAVDLYGCEDKWKNIMMRGMEADFSWERSARKYLKMYGSTLKKQKSRK